MTKSHGTFPAIPDPAPREQLLESVQATLDECLLTVAPTAAKIFEACFEILRKKNLDYAGTGELSDAYANFRTVELIGLTVEKGIIVRWLDKIKRIDNLLTQENYVTEESIEDTLRDAINYPAILLAWRQFRRSKESHLKL